MSSWDAGYTTAIDYTYGYYPDISPMRAVQQLLVAGYDFKLPEDFTYLELGYGQGVSLNLHAAANDGTYWGIDFNPAQANYAQKMAAQSGNGAVVLEASFEDFLARDDVPQFDLITLHGIYAWVSAENRHYIREIARRYLKTGGVLFISYNSQPGWGPGKPVRDLLRTVHERQSAAGGSPVESIDRGFEMLETLNDLGAVFFKRYPQELKRIEGIAKKDKTYLVHEHLNSEWEAFHFKEVAADLTAAKLGFAAPASLIDLLERINLPEKSADYLESLDDVILKETARDYLTCQQFRRDYFMRGGIKLTAGEQRKRLMEQAVILHEGNTPDELSFATFKGSQTLQGDRVRPIFEALKAKAGPMTLGELAATIGVQPRQISNFITLVLLLVHIDRLRFAYDDATIARNRPRAHAYNKVAMEDAIARNRDGYMASPVTGTATKMSPLSLLILSAGLKGHTTPKAVAGALIKNGHAAKFDLKTKTGEPLKAPVLEKEIAQRVARFMELRLPILRRLQIFDL